LLGVAAWPATLMLEGCVNNCNAACAIAQPTVFQSDAPSPVVKVVADPPCAASVATTDGGVQIMITLQPGPDSGPPECAVFEWLADGIELTAHASFSTGDGCCQSAYSNGSLSSFVPVSPQ
jgi:hypothetical protein